MRLKSVITSRDDDGGGGGYKDLVFDNRFDMKITSALKM